MALAGHVRADSGIDELEPTVGELHDDPAPVVRIRQPGNEPTALEPVEAAGHAGRREHQALAEAGRGEAVGRARDAQRAQHADLAAVEPELGKDLLFAQPDMAPETGEPGRDLEPIDAEVRAYLGPALDQSVREVACHAHMVRSPWFIC